MIIQGKNLFQLSKLGDKIPCEYFMDRDGTVFERDGTIVTKRCVHWPAILELAQKHPDWEAETKQ